MITREKFPNLFGLDDHRLSNPTSIKPPFRFGTIPNGATDHILKNTYFKEKFRPVQLMHPALKTFPSSIVSHDY